MDSERAVRTGGESAVAIATAVAAGDVRATDVVAECRDRHQRTHAGINALVQERFDEAFREAAAVDDAPSGPLAGVPVSVKECFAVPGLLTTLGIPSRRACRDVEASWLVERLRAAGAIVVGKGNVPQAMYLHETDNPVWGRTGHPEAADRGAGGSSGGDAALVAAGVVPLGVGTDLAGSIRQPAHACGIAGFVPRSVSLGDGGGFDTTPNLRVVRPRAGFLARRTGDLALACSAVGLGTTSDPAGTGAVPPRPRVGWWTDAGVLEPSPAVLRAVHVAVARLRAAGHELTELDGGIAREAAWLHLALVSADGGRDIRNLFDGSRPIPQVGRLLALAALPRAVRPWVAAVARVSGRCIEAEGLLATGPRRAREDEAIRAARLDLSARVADLAGRVDAVVCPVSALPALRHGTAATLLFAAMPCLLANLLDLPAGAVPVTRVLPEEETGRAGGRDPVVRAAVATDRGSRGLPVGVQVIALDGLERTALEVMRRIEKPAG